MRHRENCAVLCAGAPTHSCKGTGSHLMLDAWSVNSVATREKYFRILIQRLGLGMQPLCAWMAWTRAISLAIILRGHTHTQNDFNMKSITDSTVLARKPTVNEGRRLLEVVKTKLILDICGILSKTIIRQYFV